jgi:FAD/FMN-containing dehydrogenase
LSRGGIDRRAFLGAAALAVVAPEALAAAQLPAVQRRALRAAVRGHVYFPGDGGYNGARQVFNRRYDAVKPPAVVRVLDTADVVAVVRWADRYDVGLVARSGGHSYSGGSTSRTAVVVDLSRLNRISVSGSTAALGPAARNLQVYASLAARGRTIPSGSCPTVAVGGLVLGGGMGLASRAHGLTLDRVRSFDVVTAAGHRTRAEHGDLFWALRGAGAAFGIVTAIRLKTVALPKSAAYFRTVFPRAARDEALQAFNAFHPPRELTPILTLDANGATIFGQYLGGEAALRRLTTPLGGALTTGTDTYLNLQKRWAGCADGGLPACLQYKPTTFAGASAYISHPLTAPGRADFIHAADHATLICDMYGGAINEVAPRHTAFVHRHARFSVQILQYAAHPTVTTARALVAKHGNGQAYQNYRDPHQPDALHAYYGENLPRLKRLKRELDPARRFSAF